MTMNSSRQRVESDVGAVKTFLAILWFLIGVTWIGLTMLPSGLFASVSRSSGLIVLAFVTCLGAIGSAQVLISTRHGYPALERQEPGELIYLPSTGRAGGGCQMLRFRRWRRGGSTQRFDC